MSRVPRFPKLFKPARGVASPQPVAPPPEQPVAATPVQEQPVGAAPPPEQPVVAAHLPADGAPDTGGEPLVVAVPEGEAVVEAPGTAARSYRERSKLQRRLRYLRQTRELAFRDLGGFVFDQHRFARNRDDIVRAKLAGLDAIVQELQTLEALLDQHQELLILQEPGISVCPRCGVIHGSDANFCPGCALPRGSGSTAALSGPAPPAAAAFSADQPTTEFKAPLA